MLQHTRSLHSTHRLQGSRRPGPWPSSLWSCTPRRPAALPAMESCDETLGWLVGGGDLLKMPFLTLSHHSQCSVNKHPPAFIHPTRCMCPAPLLCEMHMGQHHAISLFMPQPRPSNCSLGTQLTVFYFEVVVKFIHEIQH